MADLASTLVTWEKCQEFPWIVGGKKNLLGPLSKWRKLTTIIWTFSSIRTDFSRHHKKMQEEQLTRDGSNFLPNCAWVMTHPQ